jgi:hypothetical protein
MQIIQFGDNQAERDRRRKDPEDIEIEEVDSENVKWGRIERGDDDAKL